LRANRPGAHDHLAVSLDQSEPALSCLRVPQLVAPKEETIASSCAERHRRHRAPILPSPTNA